MLVPEAVSSIRASFGSSLTASQESGPCMPFMKSPGIAHAYI